MAAKIVLLLCAQAFLMQSAYSQCLRRGYGPGYPGAGLINGAGGIQGGILGPGSCGGVASTGGGFPVTSSSPVAPTGVSIISENAIEGELSIGGNLPLLGSVAVEGAFPTAGAGSVSYGCGNDEVAINSEAPGNSGILQLGAVSPVPAPVATAALAGSQAPSVISNRIGGGSLGGLGRPGLNARAGCGCGRLY